MLSDSERASFEAELASLLGSAFSGKAAEVLRLLGDPPNPSRVPKTFWASISADLREPLTEKLAEIAVASAQAVAGANGVGVSVSWDRVNQRALAWAKRYSFELIKGIRDVSTTKIADSVSSFLENGSTGMDQLAGSLNSIFGSGRGLRIAVTEVTRASAKGEMQLVDEILENSPDAEIRTLWLTSRDELVCPVCGPKDGKAVETTGEPPAHPHCRCSLATRISV